MVGVAGVVVFLGYSVLVYGWSQVRGCNAGFLDMVAFWRPIPSCNPDGGQDVAAGAPTSSSAPPLGAQPKPTAAQNKNPLTNVFPNGQPKRIQT